MPVQPGSPSTAADAPAAAAGGAGSWIPRAWAGRLLELHVGRRRLLVVLETLGSRVQLASGGACGHFGLRAPDSDQLVGARLGAVDPEDRVQVRLGTLAEVAHSEPPWTAPLSGLGDRGGAHDLERREMFRPALKAECALRDEDLQTGRRAEASSLGGGKQWGGSCAVDQIGDM